MIKLHFWFVLLSLSFSVTSFGAADVQNAKVLYTGMTGNGRLFVGIDKVINEPGCAVPRFDVDQSNTQIKNWLSIAMTAAATGKTVNLATNGCYAGFPTLDTSPATYFYNNSN